MAKQVDQPSVIKTLIMQHVQEDINNPQYRKLADEINKRTWVIMKEATFPGEDGGNCMCRIIRAHGAYATLQNVADGCDPFAPGYKIVMIHLSKWSEYFVEFHTDFYELASTFGDVSEGPTFIEKD